MNETFRTIDFDSTRSNENIWITDLLMSYQLTQKQGNITIGISNLFNNHFNWVTDSFIFSGRNPERALMVGVQLNLWGFFNTRIQLWSAIFGLTTTEAKLTAHLVLGHSLDETSELLGVAKSTSRTHLLSVFNKTNVNRQTDLVKAVITSPLWV